jgi:hypothetical protein
MQEKNSFQLPREAHVCTERRIQKRLVKRLFESSERFKISGVTLTIKESATGVKQLNLLQNLNRNF